MIELTIDRLAYGGYGVGRHEGKVYFVPMGLPGDTLRVAVYRDQKRYAYAAIEEILKPSPDRVPAPCSYFGTCGGCQWQHLPYEKQLYWKMEILKETVERVGGLQLDGGWRAGSTLCKAELAQPTSSDGGKPTPALSEGTPETGPAIRRQDPSHEGDHTGSPLRSIIPSPKQLNYRNRIQLHVDRSGAIGFYKYHGNEIVPIKSCAIAEERINDAFAEMDPRKVRQLGWDVEFIYDHESDEVRAEVGKGTFSQVNREQNKVLIETVVSFLMDGGSCRGGVPRQPTSYTDVGGLPGNNRPRHPPSNFSKTVAVQSRILELFAGSGNFSFPLAVRGAHVTAVEQTPPDHTPALDAVPSGSVQFITGRVEKVMKKILAEKRSYETVLLDPPRKGASFVLNDIVKLKPKKIVYVSCFPPTLARDLRFFTGHGYQLKAIQPVDMFPQTYHIESVVLLQLSS